jgi:predicted acetyltransferase
VAGRRLLAFLADHRTTADQVIWAGPPAETLLLHLPTSAVSVVRYQPWLLRLVDVRAALEARGYPDGAASELHLDVHDDALPWNQGRLVLEVEGGRATARPGGAGRLRIGVRALAAVYSGHLPPVELRGAGGIEGDDDDLARLGAVFAGPAPWMPDHF